MTEALGNRRLPGDGEVDITRLLETLDAIRAEPWFAYEVFNRGLAARGPEAMARTLRGVQLLDQEK
jgi:sugar phosphate isomerase/epimerase